MVGPVRIRAGAVILSLILGVADYPTGLGAGEPLDYAWELIGPGGGGQFLGPGISPHDDNLLLCSCDMQCAYRSSDGGTSWQVLHYKQIHMQMGVRWAKNPWVFHPADPNLVFACTWHLWRSADQGRTWQALTGPWRGVKHGDKTISLSTPIMAFDRSRPDVALAAFHPRGRESVWIFTTRDRGTTWQMTGRLPDPTGPALGLVFDGTTPGTVVLGTDSGVYRSVDDGKSWVPSSDGLPGGDDGVKLVHFAGGSSGKCTLLYATVPCRQVEGKLVGGIFRSFDAGRTWQPAGQNGLFTRIIDGGAPQYQWLSVSGTDPTVVFVTMRGTCNHFESPSSPGVSTVYRSTDGGDSWLATLFRHPKMENYNIKNATWLAGEAWGWHTGPRGLVVSDTNPQRVMITTMTGVYLSGDGGTTWRPVHCPPLTQGATPRGGMPVMSSWNYYIDLHDPNRHYIAMTDKADWRSLDGGLTWRHTQANLTCGGAGWNMYAMAFHPTQPGYVWAACSPMHDIPTNAGSLSPALLTQNGGGVAFSVEYGDHWERIGHIGGLPNYPITDVCVDTDPQSDRIRLWAAAFGMGVYHSKDNGMNWEQRNTGIDPSNRYVLRVRRGPPGRLFALATYRRPPDSPVIPGALYVSTDQGASWAALLKDGKQATRLSDFAVDPNQPDVVYIAAMDNGIWKSADGGKTWHGQFDKPCFSVAIHPRQSNRIFATRFGDGLWASPDAGRTWRHIRSFPFWRPLKVVFDPDDPDTMYVATFGCSVWRGTRQ